MQLRNLTMAALMLAATSILTACWDSDDNKYSATDYFTITGSATSGYTLYRDGGGYIVPTASSVSALTQGKGFQDLERAILSYTYQDKDISEDKNSVNGAELIDGQAVDVRELTSYAQALQDGTLDKDSLFAIKGLTSLRAYRGYLTLSHVGQYAWNEKKDGFLYPTINLVYNETEQIPNEINLTLCHNERRPKSAMTAGETTFTASFRLQSLQGVIPGDDSIRINISVMGVEKPYAIRIGREDLIKGNWK